MMPAVVIVLAAKALPAVTPLPQPLDQAPPYQHLDKLEKLAEKDPDFQLPKPSDKETPVARPSYAATSALAAVHATHAPRTG